MELPGPHGSAEMLLNEFTQRILAALKEEHNRTTSYHPKTNPVYVCRSKKLGRLTSIRNFCI